MTENYLLQGDVRKALVLFALPFLGASLLHFLYGAVDLMIVGRFDDAANVSAVATGSQLMQTLTGFIAGFAAGVTILQIGLGAPLATSLQIIMQLCFLKWGSWRKEIVS